MVSSQIIPTGYLKYIKIKVIIYKCVVNGTPQVMEIKD